MKIQKDDKNMILGLVLIFSVIGIFIGFLLGLFLISLCSAGKEADAYCKGYEDGMKVNKYCDECIKNKKVHGGRYDEIN